MSVRRLTQARIARYAAVLLLTAALSYLAWGTWGMITAVFAVGAARHSLRMTIGLRRLRQYRRDGINGDVRWGGEQYVIAELALGLLKLVLTLAAAARWAQDVEVLSDYWANAIAQSIFLALLLIMTAWSARTEWAEAIRRR
jgi:hypothetical protein